MKTIKEENIFTKINAQKRNYKNIAIVSILLNMLLIIALVAEKNV